MMRSLEFRNGQKGVTLIELVIVMIVFSVLMIPLANGFINVSKSIVINDEVKAANNLVRACAEHLLYQRRIADTTTFNNTDCDDVTGFTSNGSLTITANDSDNHAPLCPAPSAGTTNCDEIVINADNNGGQSRSSISLYFVYTP